MENTEPVEDEDELREWLAWAEECVETYDPLNDLGELAFEVDGANRETASSTRIR